MDIIRIGILSDTHGLLREQVLQELQGCSVILHGGDINRQEILDRLGEIAPVHVVRGNNDKEWAEHLPFFLDLQLYGLRIFMTHRKKDLPADLSRYDLAVYGHSHKYEMKREGKTTLLNPGSCGPRRFNQDITMAVLLLDPSSLQFTINRIDIPHEKLKLSAKAPAESTDIRKTITLVMKEVKKGNSVEYIAGKLRISPQLAEQICRLYLTHPGVDADGIMTKMGL